MSDQLDKSDAVISVCGKYRYELWRPLTPVGRRLDRTLMWLMLNPSTAGVDNNDATIRRCIAFSQGWGYTRLCVGNLYAYRATDPIMLRGFNHQYQDERTAVIGPYNDVHLKKMASGAHKIVLSWGSYIGPIPHRTTDVIELLDKERKKLHVLGYTAKGQPLHPLMQPGDMKLQRYLDGIKNG